MDECGLLQHFPVEHSLRIGALWLLRTSRIPCWMDDLCICLKAASNPWAQRLEPFLTPPKAMLWPPTWSLGKWQWWFHPKALGQTHGYMGHCQTATSWVWVNIMLTVRERYVSQVPWREIRAPCGDGSPGVQQTSETTVSEPPPKDKDYLHGSIIGLLKRVLACPADHHISDDEVLFKTGISLLVICFDSAVLWAHF